MDTMQLLEASNPNTTAAPELVVAGLIFTEIDDAFVDALFASIEAA